MDSITVVVIGGLIGYWIFSDAPKVKTEEPRADPAVLARIREEERRASVLRAHAEAQQRERRRTFRTAAECFEAQYISYSRLGTYCSCPQKFKLIYLDRAESETSPYYGRGSAFHEAIQEYLAQYIGGCAPKMQSRSLSSRIYPRSERSKSAAKYFSKTFPWDARILGVEHELSYTLNGVRCYGIVDCIVEHADGTIELIDFKTGSRMPRREQLELYCLPFASLDPDAVIQLRYMMLDLGYHHVWQVDDELVQEATHRIVRLVNTISQDQQFEPVINSQCQNCGVEAPCRYGIAAYQSGKYTAYKKSKHHLTAVRKSKDTDRNGIHFETERDRQKLLGVKRKSKRGSGPTFDLSKASRDYYCDLSGEEICQGEYHFASKQGLRICESAFETEYPEQYQAAMEQAEEKRHLGLSDGYRLVSLSEMSACDFCENDIDVGEEHYALKGRKRCHRNCAMVAPKQAKPKSQKRQPQARMASASLGKEPERYCTFCKKTLPASLHTPEVIRCEKCSKWVCLECRGEDEDGTLCPLCYEPRWKRERLRYKDHLGLIDGLIQCPVDATISIGGLIYFSLENSTRLRWYTFTRVLFRYLKPGQDHNRLTRSEVSHLLQAAASELPADLRRKRLRCLWQQAHTSTSGPRSGWETTRELRGSVL